MDNEVTQKEVFDAKSKDVNSYSIYDYLKETPSVLIAGGSAIVAAVTFVARAITNINIKKTLLFWNIDINNINIDNSTLIFQSLMSIFYLLFSAVIGILIWSICKSYNPIKEYKLANKYLRKIYKKHKRTNEYREYLQRDKELRKMLDNKYWLAFIGVFVLSFVANAIYVFTSSTGNKYLIIAILICTATQLSMFIAMSGTTFTTAKRKEIKRDCEAGEHSKYIGSERLCKANADRSIRKAFSNMNLSMFAIQIIASCMLLCIASILLPVKTIDGNDSVQIAILGDTEYLVAYQDNKSLFMKEISVDEMGEQNILVVYKDKQLICPLDNVYIEIRKYDDIKILEIGEEYK